MLRQGLPNARLAASQLEQHARPDSEGHKLMRHAVARLALSARAYDRVLRVARTIADLDDSTTVRGHHVAEAIQYRAK